MGIVYQRREDDVLNRLRKRRRNRFKHSGFPRGIIDKKNVICLKDIPFGQTGELVGLWARTVRQNTIIKCLIAWSNMTLAK
jgi:hypothetical protein